MTTFLNLAELAEIARQRLKPMAWAYYSSGSGDETTLAENERAWQRRAVHYRVLAEVGERSTATSVLGHDLAVPLIVAPMAFQGLAHPDGELATARAASAAGSLMTLSTLATESIEDVVAAARGPLWFQLYIYRDRDVTAALVERARAAGARALVLTVDAPLLGRREADVRTGFHLPDDLPIKNLLPAGHERLEAVAGDSGLAAYVGTLLDPDLGWKDLQWLRGVAGELPVLVKGVVRPDDARRAVDHGAAGVIVSNHGGRQLDGAPATADVLAPIVDAVGAASPVLVDGGIRRGVDVLRALALGAKAVLIGRPILWGLAVDGEEGVAAVLEHLREELDLAMALAGCRSIDEIDRGLLDPGAQAAR